MFIGVGPGTTTPPYLYSVGLTYSFGHPDLFVVGLPTEVAHGLVRNMAQQIIAGRVFVDDEVVSDPTIANIDLRLRAVAPVSGSGLYPSVLKALHRDADAVPVLQIVWPDVRGAYPPDPSFWPMSNTLPSLGAGASYQPLLPPRPPRGA